MDFAINGNIMPSLEVDLVKGDRLYTHAGALAWMSEGIVMETSGRGSVGKMIKRALAGSSLFLPTFTCEVAYGYMSFTPNSPGQILPLELEKGEVIIARAQSFLLAESGVLFDTKLPDNIQTTLLGGAGLLLQQFTGPGRMFVQIGGEARRYDLKDGEVMKVSTGHVAMFDPTVSYSVEAVGGLANMVFSGQGLTMSTLTGPGSVWLQTMPSSKLANALKTNSSSSNSNQNSESTAAISVGILNRNKKK